MLVMYFVVWVCVSVCLYSWLIECFIYSFHQQLFQVVWLLVFVLIYTRYHRWFLWFSVFLSKSGWPCVWCVHNAYNITYILMLLHSTQTFECGQNCDLKSITRLWRKINTPTSCSSSSTFWFIRLQSGGQARPGRTHKQCQEAGIDSNRFMCLMIFFSSLSSFVSGNSRDLYSNLVRDQSPMMSSKRTKNCHWLVGYSILFRHGTSLAGACASECAALACSHPITNTKRQHRWRLNIKSSAIMWRWSHESISLSVMAYTQYTHKWNTLIQCAVQVARWEQKETTSAARR